MCYAGWVNCFAEHQNRVIGGSYESIEYINAAFLRISPMIVPERATVATPTMQIGWGKTGFAEFRRRVMLPGPYSSNMIPLTKNKT